ncbi:hypothetical protein E3U55_13685 [Filobacillus milosensis]|uniref:Uncharacterized protein n=1 Tax=Filobacillus milosensis TaxID=94137 RepID=A0A4Y8IGS6_9BACI|nr:hypothetical protein [Filobacillus milosensis]TFB14231.1 hypothetical protein E3U55_13685 [Filobacillus milosensis]
MSVTDFNAAKKWSQVPKDIQKNITSNVFCGRCGGVTTIVDYNIKDDNMGIILKGKCINCDKGVARFVED